MRATVPLPEWRATLTALSLLVAWVFLWYWNTLESMAVIWSRSETYAHGFIVPPIALWLVWREREQLKRFQPHATAWMAIPLGVSVFLWLLGELTAVNALAQFSIIAILVLAIASLLGVQLTARIAFPLIFLFFAVPIGDFMLPKLMEWTAKFTVVALRWSGIPVYQDGLQFVIPSGHWSVIEACSGVRYIIASVTVGTLFAYINYSSLKRRLIFIAVSLLVPVVANWLRAYLIVMLGHLSNNKLAAGVDHIIYGWVFFGIVIAIMFMIGMRWSEPPIDVFPATTEAEAAVNRQRKPWLTTTILAIILVMGPFAFKAITETVTSTPVSMKPPSIEGWAPTSPISSWEPSYANPSVEMNTAYAQNDKRVGLYVAYYRNQDFEHKLVTSTNVLVTSTNKEWSMIDAGQRQIEPAQLSARAAEIVSKTLHSDNRLTVWYWYWINGHLTSNEIVAKLYTAFSQLTGRGDDSAVIVVYAPKETADESLPAFVGALAPVIHQQLSQAGKR